MEGPGLLLQSRPRRSCCSGPFAPLFLEMEASKIEHATTHNRRKPDVACWFFLGPAGACFLRGVRLADVADSRK